MGVYIGLDIGGTKFMAAAADQDGRILRRMRLPGAGTLEEDLAILHHMVQATAAGEEISGWVPRLGVRWIGRAGWFLRCTNLPGEMFHCAESWNRNGTVLSFLMLIRISQPSVNTIQIRIFHPVSCI